MLAALALLVVLGAIGALLGLLQTRSLAAAFREEVRIHDRVGRFRGGLLDLSHTAHEAVLSRDPDTARAFQKRYEALAAEARRCDACHVESKARARVEALLTLMGDVGRELTGGGAAHDAEDVRALLERYQSATGTLRAALVTMENRFAALVDRQSLLGTEVVDRSTHQFWFFVGAIVLIAVIASFWLARAVNAPIRNLIDAARRIGAGDQGYHVEAPRDPELAELAREFGEMTTKVTKRADEAALGRLLDRVISSQEEERKRVARELHDQVGQSLAALLIKLRSEVGQATGSEQLVREILDQVRRMAWDLRPSILTDHGLEAALARYAEEETKERSRVPIDFQYGCNPGVPRRFAESLELVVYRVAQEAIRNAVAHADASRVSVVVVREESQVTLVVEDDGRGFEVEAVRGNGRQSVGLMGMEERVVLAGGDLSISSSPGAGCTVRARIPIAGSAAEEGEAWLSES